MGHYCDERNPAENFKWVITAPRGVSFEPDFEFDELPNIDNPPLSYWLGQNGRVTEFHSAICLLPMVESFSIELLEIFPHWERGVMPLPGALLEQPQIIFQTMRIISNARANLKRD